MITFKGTKKEFFKAYPKEERSLKETYKLINSSGEVEYKFVAGLGEKCFKKSDIPSKNETKTATKIGHYTSWQTIYDKLGDVYEELCLKNRDIITDENRLSFEYLFVAARGFQDFPVEIEDFQNFFSVIGERIKNPSLKEEWLKLGKSFVYNTKTKNQKFAKNGL